MAISNYSSDYKRCMREIEHARAFGDAYACKEWSHRAIDLVEKARNSNQIPEHMAIVTTNELNQLFLQAQDSLDQAHQKTNRKATQGERLLSLSAEEESYDAALTDVVDETLDVTRIYDSCATTGMSLVKVQHR